MRDLYQAIVESIDAGRSVAVATIVDVKGSSPAAVNSKMLIWANGKIMGTVGGGCLENDVRLAGLACLDTGKSRLLKVELTAARAEHDGLICGGVVTVHIEPLATSNLIIFGGGHISSEICKHAKLLDFKICIVDDRERYANKDRFPLADETIAQGFEDYVSSAQAPADSYIIIVTRGHAYDAVCLEWALKQNAKYIGMIGSATKRDNIYQELMERGVSAQVLKEVRCPIGLDIGAVTREEIGISIAAELVKIKRFT